MFVLTQFPNASRVFSDTANITIVYNLRYETLFSVFRAFVFFFQKKTPKSDLKPWYEKKLGEKKGPSRDPFGDPKLIKNYIKNLEDCKNAENKKFFEGAVC